jgi:hypothetical protein
MLMKVGFPLFCFAALAFADDVRPQDKADFMFLFPEKEPFSFVTLYGSRAAYETVKFPKRLEVYRISSLLSWPQAGRKTILGHEVLSGPVVPPDKTREELVSLFTAKDTFRSRPTCGREPGVLLRAISGKVTVDLLFCFKCTDVDIVRNDKRAATSSPLGDRNAIQVSMTPTSVREFLRLFQSMFPKDEELKDIKLE